MLNNNVFAVNEPKYVLMCGSLPALCSDVAFYCGYLPYAVYTNINEALVDGTRGKVTCWWRQTQKSHQWIDEYLISSYLVCIDRSSLKGSLAVFSPQDGSLQCPSCKTIYGEKTGTQPKGKMEIYSIAQSLPGHPDCGTIQIIYSIPPGIQVRLYTEVPQWQVCKV